MTKIYVGTIRDYTTRDPNCNVCQQDDGRCLAHSTVTGWKWATLTAEGVAATHAEAWAAAEAA